jgi:phosphate ABC transporter permease protein PstC
MDMDRSGIKNSVESAMTFSRPLVLSPGQDLRGYLASRIGRLMLLLITSASVLAVLFIFLFVIREAWPFLTKFGLKDFLFSLHWYPTSASPEYGCLTMIVGSLYVTFGALVIAGPTGLLAAVFLSDMAPFKVRQVVKPVIELLAAIPSVAYGFFAVLVLAPWLQRNLSFPTGTNAMNASLILAVMALPTVISLAEDSLWAAGREIREASYGLGATRAETLIKVVIPAAHSGIIAAVILGMMRAVGETMVVWMASGNANQIPTPWWDFSQAVRTMTATIAGDMGETARGTDHYRALFAIGFLLLIFTLILNLVSEYFLSKVNKRSKPKTAKP